MTRSKAREAAPFTSGLVSFQPGDWIITSHRGNYRFQGLVVVTLICITVYVVFTPSEPTYQAQGFFNHSTSPADTEKSSDGQISSQVNEKSSDGQISSNVNEKSSDGQISSHVNEKSSDGQIFRPENEKSSDGQISSHVNEKSSDGQISSHVNDKSSDRQISSHVNEKSPNGPIFRPGNEKSSTGSTFPPGNEKSSNASISPPGNEKSSNRSTSPPRNEKSSNASISPPGNEKSSNGSTSPPGNERSSTGSSSSHETEISSDGSILSQVSEEPYYGRSPSTPGIVMVQPVSTAENESQASRSDTQPSSCPTKYQPIRFSAWALNETCRHAIFFPGQDPYDPNLKYLMVIPKGRLGNTMFVLSSVLGIAHAQNRAVCFDARQFPFSKLKGAIQIGWNKGHTWLHVQAWKWGTFDPCLLKLAHRNIVIDGFLQSYKYFNQSWENIKDVVTFQDSVWWKASRLLNGAWDRKTYPRHTTAVVGIHVRRDDMVNRGKKTTVRTTPTKAYFFNAIRWMKMAIPDKRVVFIVTSDDMAWCDKHLSGEDIKMAPPALPATHMALLARCDHVIMSVGTFGWWGGWWSGGKVVYYKHFPAKVPWLAKNFKAEDHFLPSWVGME